MRRWHSIHIHILHKMHKQYATKEIEKKTCNNDLLLFSTENFNKQQKLIPKGSQSHSSDFTMRRNQGFFRPSISPKLAPRRHAIFFSADESRTGRQGRHSCRVSSGDENGIVETQHGCLSRRFLLILKGNNKKCKGTAFSPGLFG